MTTPADQPDLIAWLRAQLDDDERTAKRVEPNQAPVQLRAMVTREGSAPFLVIDSARVLAEVEAKRRILDLHTGEHECSTITYQQGVPEVDRYSYVLETEHCTTVLLLALPYAARPGYRDEWRP